ncbi:MAG: flagellar hook protein FlgE [Magnetospirillum sp.]|nr:flagellar hook protein FlgE [Magnetospirillum sp.]
MSIEGAMLSAVSGLQAQGQAIAIISDNLANANTTGYKGSDGSFIDMVTQQTTGSQYASGGVLATTRQNVGAQGLIATSSHTTDMAVDGNGMFVVQQGLTSGPIGYTRDGEFSPDSQGNLALNGTYYLMGWPTDSSGNIVASNVNNTSALSVVNIDRFNSSAAATKNFALQANLPADSTVGATFTTALQIYDSLGVAQSIPATWKNNGGNDWTMTVTDPTSPSSTTPTTGDLNAGGGVPDVFDVKFNSNGSLDTITSTSGGGSVNAATNLVTIPIASWTDGAAGQSIALNLGTPNSTSGLTQYAMGQTPPIVDIHSQSQDGVPYGKMTGITIGTDGTLTANYDNGQKLPIYKVPLAIFPNYDGLLAGTDGVYSQTATSGQYVLREASVDGAGAIRGGALENSTVDTSAEFSKMIVAQQAYSAAATVISTGKQLYQTLEQAVQ